MFTCLLLVLTYKKVKGTGQIGKLTIVIAIFSLLNGIISLLRVDSTEPYFNDNDEELKYELYYWLESVFFFGATWFFSIRYYETASDLKHILSDDLATSQILTRSRKRTCKMFRWCIFILIFLAQSLESISFAFYDILNDNVARVLFGIGFSVLCIVIVAITVLMALALYKFIKIVSRTSRSKRDLNFWGTVLQIFSLIVWTVAWIAEGVIILDRSQNLHEYEPFRNAVIIDAVGQVVNLFYFIIIAYVIYKSSKVFGGKNDPILQSNVSLLA